MLGKIIQSLRYGAPVVVVSGLPRSGTSMAMKMLDAGGLELITDTKREADIDNPKGYFEDERVMRLAETQDKAWVRHARGKGIKVISFLLKDLPDSNRYKVIFMRRAVDEVLASQKKMLERRGEQDDIEDERMYELWKDHLWRVNYLLKNRKNFEWIEIRYTEALEDPQGVAARIADFVGGIDSDEMARVVDASLYRNRAATA